jgi:hypothetical protein
MVVALMNTVSAVLVLLPFVVETRIVVDVEPPGLKTMVGGFNELISKQNSRYISQRISHGLTLRWQSVS